MRLNAKNNAETKLAEPVSESDTSIVVEDASVLPEVPYRLSIGDEIVEVTEVADNTLTVDRAVEGTEAFSHDAGSMARNRFTAGMYDGIETYVDNKIDDIPETDLSEYVRGQEFSTHKEKIASETELGHVKAETDEEGNLILPEAEIKVDDKTVFLNEEGELTTRNPYADDLTDAPGAKKLIAGDMNAGFFGEVPASELFTASEIASECGISEGDPQHEDEPWLKFASKSKIIFIPRKTIRNRVSYNAIHEAGCVFGDTRVSKDSNYYKVRLMKSSTIAEFDEKDSKKYVIGSEWNNLMLPIHENAIIGDWTHPDYVNPDTPIWNHEYGSGQNGLYSNDELKGTSSNGSRYITQSIVTNKFGTKYIGRGYGSSNDVSHYSSTGSGGDDRLQNGWGPVLEVVE